MQGTAWGMTPMGSGWVAGMQGMGFDAVKAREALEEADCDLDAAIEWLLASCV